MWQERNFYDAHLLLFVQAAAVQIQFVCLFSVYSGGVVSNTNVVLILLKAEESEIKQCQVWCLV